MNKTKLVKEFRDFFCNGLKNIWGTLTPDDRKDNEVYCKDIYGNLYRVIGFEDDKENNQGIIKVEKI
jgi:hypothetical protein